MSGSSKEAEIYVTGLLSKQGNIQPVIDEIWDMLDVDKSGYLDKAQELKMIMKTFAELLGINEPRQNVLNALFIKQDDNVDNSKINKKEFTYIIRKFLKKLTNVNESLKKRSSFNAGDNNYVN